MSIIVSIAFVNTRDLAHCEAWASLLSSWKQIYSFPGGGSFLTGVWNFLINYLCVGVVPINACAPSEVTLWLFFLCVSNDLSSSSTATFAIKFWSFFEIFGDYFLILSAGFLCTAAVVVEDLVLVDDELSFISMFLSYMLWKMKFKQVL